jgi:predicted MFS family arabinose efflux permease
MILRSSKRNVLTLVLLMLTVSGGVHHPTVIAPFLNEMSSDFGVSEALMGQVGTISFACTLAVAAVVAPFIGRLELTRVLWAALLLLGITGLVTAVATEFWMLFPIRGLAGFAGGLIWGGSFAAVARAWSDPDERKTKMGFVVGFVAGGPALMTPALRVIGQASSWEMAVVTHAVLYLVVAVAVFAFMTRLPGQPGNGVGLGATYRATGSVLLTPTVGFPLVQRLVSQTLFNSILVFLAGFVAAEYIDAEVWIGPVFSMIALGFMTVSFLASRIIRVVGSPLRAVQVGTFASVIGAVGVAWITPHPALTALFVLLFGFSIGVYFNGLIAIIMDGARDRQDTAIFVVGAIGPMGGMFGAALGGLAVGATADYAGWKVLIAVLAAVLLTAMFGTRRAVLTRAPQPVAK